MAQKKLGKSVSRVGGKTQLPAYRSVAGDLRLSYAQFEELESFSRFGTRLDEATRQTIERSRRVREVLKQSQYEPMPAAEQARAASRLASMQAAERSIDERLEELRSEFRYQRQHAITEELLDIVSGFEALNEA